MCRSSYCCFSFQNTPDTVLFNARIVFCFLNERHSSTKKKKTNFETKLSFFKRHYPRDFLCALTFRFGYFRPLVGHRIIFFRYWHCFKARNGKQWPLVSLGGEHANVIVISVIPRHRILTHALLWIIVLSFYRASFSNWVSVLIAYHNISTYLMTTTVMANCDAHKASFSRPIAVFFCLFFRCVPFEANNAFHDNLSSSFCVHLDSSKKHG